MSRDLHIITHDVPYPADFGGVMDIYFKIKSLHEAGVKIHLHCFVNRRPPQPVLDKYCETVQYYKRKKFGLSLRLPYIVSSRDISELISNLKKDHHPVLMEGIHSTYALFAGALEGRKVFIRLFNTEFRYYEHLAKHESNFLKKLYLKTESRLLKKYEQNISSKAEILCLSETDKEIYSTLFAAQRALFLPAFLPWDEVIPVEGKGKYCLYNGNLSISENEEAVLWLIREVFSKTDIPFMIAGKSPSQKLISAVNKYQHISLVADPDEASMQTLIENAQVSVLPSMNATGVKLKMLNALFNGRHCLTNTAGNTGSGVEDLCHTADSGPSFLEKTIELFNTAFSSDEHQKRRSAISLIYNNELNAKKLIAWIW